MQGGGGSGGARRGGLAGGEGTRRAEPLAPCDQRVPNALADAAILGLRFDGAHYLRVNPDLGPAGFGTAARALDHFEANGAFFEHRCHRWCPVGAAAAAGAGAGAGGGAGGGGAGCVGLFCGDGDAVTAGSGGGDGGGPGSGSGSGPAVVSGPWSGRRPRRKRKKMQSALYRAWDVRHGKPSS